MKNTDVNNQLCSGQMNFDEWELPGAGLVGNGISWWPDIRKSSPNYYNNVCNIYHWQFAETTLENRNSHEIRLLNNPTDITLTLLILRNFHRLFVKNTITHTKTLFLMFQQFENNSCQRMTDVQFLLLLES